MILNIIFILAGFVMLVKGGDWLIDGATSIAQRAKLSPMVIGITILGFGTSMPELFVSLQAALANSPGLSIGNIVGSNIANIALILGATAAITPCSSSTKTLKVDMPVMIAACLLLTAIGMTGTISRIAGITAVLAIIFYTAWEIKRSRHNIAQKGTQEPVETKKNMQTWKAATLCVFSLALMVTGANILIHGASDIARTIGETLGTSPEDIERIIGLTIVAVGTSLPELSASVMAARKGQTDMAVGNIIGSVIFNILCGIGLSAAICPITNSDRGFLIDYLLMGALALLLWIFMRSKHTLDRWEGFFQLAVYLIYLAYTLTGG